MSQTRKRPRWVMVAKYLPLGLTAAMNTSSPWSAVSINSFWLATSHTRAVRSHDAVIASLPSRVSVASMTDLLG